MKKVLRITSIFLLLVTAINATAAGILFILEPSGSKLGMSVSYIKDSPFTSFLIPGIVLFVVNGLLNFVAAFHQIRKKAIASKLVIIQGILLCGWIVIQIFMVKDVSALHVIMFIIGILLIVLELIQLRLKKKANL